MFRLAKSSTIIRGGKLWEMLKTSEKFINVVSAAMLLRLKRLAAESWSVARRRWQRSQGNFLSLEIISND
jgi:hypothetical protein